MRAARLVSVLGVFSALWGVVAAVSIVWGRVWGLNMPNTPRGIDSLPQLVSFQQSGDVAMTVLDLPIWVRVLSAAPGLVEALGLAGSAFLLVGLLVAIGDGDSFGTVVRRNLRGIAWLLVATAVVVTAVDALAIWRVQASIWAFGAASRDAGQMWSVGYGERFPAVPWLPLALGIVAAALSWAFRDGAALEKEAEGVV